MQPDKLMHNHALFSQCLRWLGIGFLFLGGCSDSTPTKSPPVTNVPDTNLTQPADKSSPPKSSRPPAEPKPQLESNKPLSDADANPPMKPQPVFRPSDTRPKHDDQKLSQLGIKRYESKHLLLYTDIDPKIAKTLPPVIDAVYPHWETYFGKLPPDREGSVFQLTGYLMTDKELYRKAGLIPPTLPPFPNGRQQGAEFWMVEQKQDYYRRHLLLHEATHGYCNFVPVTLGPPIWYLEGIAELFGTHHTDKSGRFSFRVMPDDKSRFRGWGRIRIIQDAYKANKALPLDETLTMPAKPEIDTEQYAWWWAISAFLDEHPRYQSTFRKLAKRKTRSQFQTLFAAELQPHLADLRTEWMLYIQGLDYGYDIRRAAITFQKGVPLEVADPPAEIKVTADRGWQSSRVIVQKGEQYRILAEGRFILGTEPKPWVSEPQGITYTYFADRPIGTLIAAIRDESGTNPGSMLTSYRIGRGITFTAPLTGTLYLRLNDAFNQLHDNSGHCVVQIQWTPSDH